MFKYIYIITFRTPVTDTEKLQGKKVSFIRKDWKSEWHWSYPLFLLKLIDTLEILKVNDLQLRNLYSATPSVTFSGS